MDLFIDVKPDNESRVDLNQDNKGQGPDNRNIVLHVHLVCHTVETGHLRYQIGSNMQIISSVIKCSVHH